MKKTKAFFTLILNPVAGNGRSVKIFNHLKQVLTEQDLAFKINQSQKVGDIFSLTKKYGQHSHSIDEFLIIIGGDGSFNEALNGIKNSKFPTTPLAYLPAGSGNDFARAAHLTAEPEKLVKNLLHSAKVKQVDCGSYTSNYSSHERKYFINNLGIGFDAYVVKLSNQAKIKSGLNKFNLGNLVYAFNIINVLRKQDTFNVDIWAQQKHYHFDDAYFVTTTNHPYFGGGIPILPSAKISSHVLNTVVVEKPSLHKFIYLFAKLLKDGSHVYDPHFHNIEGQEIKVQVKKREFAQIDGENTPAIPHDINFHIDSFYLYM